MKGEKLHYGWIVIFMGLLATIAAHGFGRMSYTIILPAMKDGLQFNYTQLGLLGTGNFLTTGSKSGATKGFGRLVAIASDIH